MPPRVKIVEIDAFERDVVLRLPFRFGAATLRQAPQAFVRVRVVGEDGRSAVGGAAEMMVPKWFDKTPDLTTEDNVDQLRDAIAIARAAALDASEPMTLFAAARINEAEVARRSKSNPLVAGFGPALIARAALDAFCRLADVSFFDAVRNNLIGMGGEALPADIETQAATEVLGRLRPASSIGARHTIGLLDAITDAEVTEPVADGLPESLRAAIACYGHEWFKIKLSGDVDADLERLNRIADVLGRLPKYRVTLDGNEQFAGPDAVDELLSRMEADARLAPLVQAIAYVEQPFPRSATLALPLGRLADRLPFLIDESDDCDEAFGQARALGYRGVSSKTCKGIYRSLLKAIRIRSGGDPRLFLSGEDLTCQVGLSVQQDLALVSLLGLTHVERNGHHYVNGMQGASKEEMDRFATAHPALYGRGPSGLHLAIRGGQISICSLAVAGYASGTLPDFETMQNMSSEARGQSRDLTQGRPT